MDGWRDPAAKRLLIHIILWTNTAFMLFPCMIVVLSAFKSTSEIYASPFALPAAFKMDNLATILRETNFPRYLVNSLIVTGGSILCLLTFGTLAAYALARYSFRGR
ncbi:MAG: hypothetical protein ACRC56_08530 [Bosea sp. (in: a-proteobacteria)]